MQLIEKGLIWLSAADSKVLDDCPKWERLKYAAFGASLLVPFLFGMIAASYAVSTLTENTYIIAGFAIVWGFIIITIDRVLLATYRAFIGWQRKMIQFLLRITVAVLMGLTVSHPLTLMLFKDTINSEIEKDRIAQMAGAGRDTESQRESLNEQISLKTQALQDLNQQYQEAMAGGFLNGNSKTPEPQVSEDTAIRYSPASNPQFADIDAQIKGLKDQRDQVQIELNRFQRDYDDEISGARTGKPGIGPEARAIERDQLVWRREDVREFNTRINSLTTKRIDLSAKLMADSARDNAVIEQSRRELEQQKLEIFKSRQGDMLSVIKSNIDAVSAELGGLTSQSTQISENTRDRVDSLKGEKRADLMVQTLALHHLFEKEGGGFALAVYVVVALLFTLIDTIPLVVKFFAVPGVYDYEVECKEGVSENKKVIQKCEDLKTEKRKETRVKEATQVKEVAEIKEQTEIKKRAIARLSEAECDNSLSEIERFTKRQLSIVESVRVFQPGVEDVDELESVSNSYRPTGIEIESKAASKGEAELDPSGKVEDDPADNVIDFEQARQGSKTDPDGFPLPRSNSETTEDLSESGEDEAGSHTIEIKPDKGIKVTGISPIKTKPQADEPKRTRPATRALPKVTSSPTTSVARVESTPEKQTTEEPIPPGQQTQVVAEVPSNVPGPRAKPVQKGAVPISQIVPSGQPVKPKTQPIKVDGKEDLRQTFSEQFLQKPYNDKIETPVDPYAPKDGFAELLMQGQNPVQSTPHPPSDPNRQKGRIPFSSFSLDPVTSGEEG